MSVEEQMDVMNRMTGELHDDVGHDVFVQQTQRDTSLRRHGVWTSQTGAGLDLVA